MDRLPEKEGKAKVKFKMVSVVELFTPFIQAARENSMNTRLKTAERLTFLVLILTCGLITSSLLPRALAETSILTIDPSSGSVGTSVTVTANVTTPNGGYEVYFDTSLTVSDTASGNSVNATFIVPQATAGSHNVTVVDVSTGDNATGTFTVTTSFSLDVPVLAEPLQENGSIPISVNVTGGELGSVYAANITVQAPTNASYVKMLSVGASASGNGTATAVYPSEFSAGANTSFVGSYGVFFNTTMGYKTFSVGLTNSTEYHRTETVNVRAAYQPDENVTLTIAGYGIHESVNLTDPSGLVSYDWVVPLNASKGNYTVSFVSLSGYTVKSPPDVQNFTVPGYAVNFTSRNLAGESVPSVTITGFENGNVVDNTTTSAAGLGTLMLEVGNFTCEAYALGENVGELRIEVNETVSLDFFCNLTNLRVQVLSLVNGAEVGIPDVGVYFTPYGNTYITDLNGTVTIHSLLPDLPYGLNVTRYGTSFNLTSIPELLVNGTAVAWFNVTAICPTLTLAVTVTKAGGQAFDYALVRVQEFSGAPLYELYSDPSGSATFYAPLGRYTVSVYHSSGLLLNETTVDLFQSQSASLQCDLYGLALSVRVVDYFGQGIANVDVKLLREGVTIESATTQGDGTATFPFLIGGDLELDLYLSGSTQPAVAQGIYLRSSTTVRVSMGKYVVFAGLLVETSEFATVIVIVLAVVFVLALEVYRLRRSRAKKGEAEAESSDKES